MIDDTAPALAVKLLSGSVLDMVMCDQQASRVLEGQWASNGVLVRRRAVSMVRVD